MLTIFSTPKPFLGHIGTIQRNALHSWKLLHPDAEIILFGDDAGTADVCREFGLRHEPIVQRSEFGTKRLDSIFGTAQKIARHNILSYANCDIILTQDFVRALGELLAWRSNFLMIGRRWDVDVTEPLDFSASNWETRILTRAKSEGLQRLHYNIDYFLFQRGLYPRIPPLVIGRIWWDHWLVQNAHQGGAPVVDVSSVVCAIHQNHDYGYHPQGMAGVWNDEEARRNLALLGGKSNSRTIEDAEFRLTPQGVSANRFYWLAPAKRRWRDMAKVIRTFVRLKIWFPLLALTRPIRHAFGVKAENVPVHLRNRNRRHWLDQ